MSCNYDLTEIETLFWQVAYNIGTLICKNQKTKDSKITRLFIGYWLLLTLAEIR